MSQVPEAPYLKYLFTAIFDDGTEYQQTPDDKSKIEPDKRSCFYDILHLGKRVIKFILIDQTNPNNWVGIDLEEGVFMRSGAEFIVGNQIVPVNPFEVFYEMQVQKHMDVTYQIKTGKIQKVEPRGEDRIFYIGLTIKDAQGQEIKRIVGVA